jgi:hypothetical protein
MVFTCLRLDCLMNVWDGCNPSIMEFRAWRPWDFILISFQEGIHVGFLVIILHLLLGLLEFDCFYLSFPYFFILTHLTHGFRISCWSMFSFSRCFFDFLEFEDFFWYIFKSFFLFWFAVLDLFCFTLFSYIRYT